MRDVKLETNFFFFFGLIHSKLKIFQKIFIVICFLFVQAEDFQAADNPIIAVKGARVSDYGGRSLSVLQSSIMEINPDIPKAHQLKGW